MEIKEQTSIEELIENYIPNSYGLTLDPKLLKQIWLNPIDSQNFEQKIL